MDNVLNICISKGNAELAASQFVLGHIKVIGARGDSIHIEADRFELRRLVQHGISYRVLEDDQCLSS